MNNLFTVKVRYTKQFDNGSFKRVTEPYLVAAMSVTDAEARIYEELGSVVKGEFIVKSVTTATIHDIFAYDDSDVWYNCKVIYENFDSDAQKAKKTTQMFLVTANNVKEAYDRITESLKGLMIDFTITSVSVSPIVEIFTFKQD